MLPTTTYGYVRLTKANKFNTLSYKQYGMKRTYEKYEGKVVMFNGRYSRDTIKEMLWEQLKKEGIAKGDYYRYDKDGYAHTIRDNEKLVMKHFKIFCWQ